MTLTYQIKEGIPIVALSGHFINIDTAPVRRQLIELIEKSSPYLIIDLTQLNVIDASALSVFVSARQKAQEYQGEILLLNPTPAVRNLIEIIHLQDIFSIYIDEAAALAHCNQSLCQT
jgi:anti-sigma B factor antagonist